MGQDGDTALLIMRIEHEWLQAKVSHTVQCNAVQIELSNAVQCNQIQSAMQCSAVCGPMCAAQRASAALLADLRRRRFVVRPTCGSVATSRQTGGLSGGQRRLDQCSPPGGQSAPVLGESSGQVGASPSQRTSVKIITEISRSPTERSLADWQLSVSAGFLPSVRVCLSSRGRN